VILAISQGSAHNRKIGRRVRKLDVLTTVISLHLPGTAECTLAFDGSSGLPATVGNKSPTFLFVLKL
jgi:hypothetical protein